MRSRDIQFLVAQITAVGDNLNRRLDGIDGRLDGIDDRLTAIDQRLGRIEGRLDQVVEDVLALKLAMHTHGGDEA